MELLDRNLTVRQDRLPSRLVTDVLYRLVCVPAALAEAPTGWTADLLRDGELALLVDAGGLAAIDAVAHELDLVTVPLVRSERTAELQEQTVIAYAGSLPTVWIAPSFGEATKTWARERGPMTLLVELEGPLPADERRRVERFVALLGRQAE